MPKISDQTLADLPGGLIIQEGLRDLAAGRESIASLLIAVGFPRLELLGIVPATANDLPPDPELKLYRLLGRLHGLEAHSQYNAWIRQLVSFERALEHRIEA